MLADRIEPLGSAVERLSLRIPGGFVTGLGRRYERRGDTVRAAGVGPGWDFPRLAQPCRRQQDTHAQKKPTITTDSQIGVSMNTSQSPKTTEEQFTS